MNNRTLKSKMLLLQDDLVASRVSGAFNRISTVAGYGYRPAISSLSRLLQTYKNNGGIPDLLYDAGLSVNYNLVAGSALITTANGWSAGVNTVNNGAVTDPEGGNTARSWSFTSTGFAFLHRNVNLQPNTTYTASVWCRSNTPPAFQSRIEIRENNGATFYQTQQTVFTLTTSWQRIVFTFTTGATTSFAANSQFHITRPDQIYGVELAFPQIVIGTDRVYRPRTNTTAPLSLNLGVLGGTGDGTFINGSVNNMLASDTGLVTRYDATAIQYIQSSYAFNPLSNYTIMFWARPTNLAAQRSFFGFNSVAGSIELQHTATTLRFNRDGAGNITAPNYVMSTTQYTHIAVTWNGTTRDYAIYTDGTLLVAGNNAAGFSAGSLLSWGASFNNTEPFLGNLNLMSIENLVLTDAQILNIRNAQKSQYGY